MKVWQTLVESWANPLVRGAAGTVVAVAAAAALYGILRRRLIGPEPKGENVKTNRRLLRGAMAFLLAVVLVTLWAAVLTETPAGGTPEAMTLLRKLLWTVALAVGVYIAAAAIQRLITKNLTGIEAKHRARLATSWLGIGVFVVGATIVWAAGAGDLGIFLGLVGAGVALSLQETLLCMVGWLVLIIRRPYDIGDRIEIDSMIGDVIGVSALQTTMLEVGNWIAADQSTGRMLIIPNSMVIRRAIYNYAKGFPFIWDELSILVTFESDWHEAENLLLAAAEVESDKIAPEVRRQITRMQQHYAIRYQHFTPVVYTSIAGNGVDLTLRYLCPIRERRAVTHRISRNVLEALAERTDIDFAYPTTRIFRNNEEGKPGAGGPPRPQRPESRTL